MSVIVTCLRIAATVAIVAVGFVAMALILMATNAAWEWIHDPDRY